MVTAALRGLLPSIPGLCLVVCAAAVDPTVAAAGSPLAEMFAGVAALPALVRSGVTGVAAQLAPGGGVMKCPSPSARAQPQL